MTFEQLRIFLAVAQHLHFTRAAEALYLTQPSVSAAIQSLEEEIGMLLFHRIGRRIEITQAGELLKGEAQKILDQVALTKRGLQELSELQRGELRLGASQTIGNYWLPGLISQFKTQYPGIQVHCILGNTQEISTGTVSGNFDFGLVEGIVSPAALACLDQQVIGGDRLQVVVGQAHPWFERQTVPLSELSTTDWVMREAGSGTREIFEQALRDWGMEPTTLNVILEMSSGEMIKAVVENGIGATVISEWMVNKEVRFGILRTVAIADSSQLPPVAMVRSFKLLKHRERFQTRIAQRFEQLLLTATVGSHSTWPS
ncbi:MAG TPA: LysR substrate-binding domain-containing protein [Coleofasciculaceae cyanobacterium]